MTTPIQRQDDPRTPLPAPAVEPPKLPRPIAAAPPWLDQPQTRRHIDQFWLTAAALLLALGSCYFGWRAIVSVGITTLATVITYALGTLVLNVFKRRPTEGWLYAVWIGMLTGISLPVFMRSEVAVLVGIATGVFAHLFGRTRPLRVHPAALAVVVVSLIPIALLRGEPSQAMEQIFEPVWGVVTPSNVIVGDLRDFDADAPVERTPWYRLSSNAEFDATRRVEPYRMTIDNQEAMLLNANALKNLLASGEMHRLEEILLGSVPGLIGATSAVAVIFIGMIAIYRRLSWWPIPLAAVIAWLATLMVMPIETDDQTRRVVQLLFELGPEIAISYLSYMLLTSPLLFVVMLMAPQTAPISGTGRIAYGVLIGSIAIGLQWTTQSPVSPFAALAMVSLFSRPFDAVKRSRFTRA